MIIAEELKIEWEHLFRAFLGLFRRKLECSIANVGTNCKTTTSNGKNTSKIQKLNFGGDWTA